VDTPPTLVDVLYNSQTVDGGLTITKAELPGPNKIPQSTHKVALIFLCVEIKLSDLLK
jgi:hypothetical protein